MTAKSELTENEFGELKKLPIFKSRVVSGSMLPIIQIGEEVVVEVGQHDIKRFDIIVIYLGNKLVCHYLWRKNKVVKPILLQTRNMKNDFDFPVQEEHYLGKVISHKISFWKKVRLLF